MPTSCAESESCVCGLDVRDEGSTPGSALPPRHWPTALLADVRGSLSRLGPDGRVGCGHGRLGRFEAGTLSRRLGLLLVRHACGKLAGVVGRAVPRLERRHFEQGGPPMKIHPQRPLLADIHAELNGLGSELREMAAARWELARLELESDLLRPNDWQSPG